MNTFSVFNYESLSEEQKNKFNQALAQKLSTQVEALMNDDVIGTLDVKGFVASEGKNASIVSELYHRLTGGIQAGSGNQVLFNSVVADYSESWASLTE